ncbi:DUF429 domain-containing protein [Acrocarpospora catenulata]|uniref:DUF429 domain-containing protein n=1 Tax=Acrocarpospora catenulata TaxID=2836182 RepID=UPI001BDB2A30|nr:DUF429 domain-containing protein [Acrocarpospora catenulata]
MITCGVDLAAEAVRTAVAWISWSPEGARVTRIETQADDQLIVEAITDADKSGIDCPLGWPETFLEFVAKHRENRLDVPLSTMGRVWRRDLAYRRTDLIVHELTGRQPLSVAADRIAHVAMRCAGLMAELARRGQNVDRTGQGAIVEVYPAASLKQWGLSWKSYKRSANLPNLTLLVDALQTAAPWLDLGPYEDLCRRSDDATDAVVAALTARAAALHLVTVPTPDQAVLARAEGWIAVPTTSIGKLHA